MILAEELAYGLDQRLNKLSTNVHQMIPVEDKVIALNDSVIVLIKRKISPNNIHRIGLDGFKKRYQDLQFLVENFEDHPLDVKLGDKKLNKYIAYVSDLKPKFMFYLDSYMIADKGECKDNVIYGNGELAKHADITTLLRNSNYTPSFEYQEMIVDISSDELHFYTDGSFTPKKVYLSYIRYPKPIDIEGYVHLDGTESNTADCELEDYLKDEILDLAVERLAMYTENTPAANAAKARQQDNE
ncbi:MAG TPA: hypothetical protein PLS56_01465 [Candidatus Dojkabacteria bacterium]|nr:hypothetical protein [Candidatus Dojkabacteria bacterium]